MFDSFGVRFVPPFSKKKPNFQNGQKAEKIGQTLTSLIRPWQSDESVISLYNHYWQ